MITLIFRIDLINNQTKNLTNNYDSWFGLIFLSSTFNL